MSSTPSSLHAEAALSRRLVLFGKQLEVYLAHFPNCHKYALTQTMRQAFVDVYCLQVEAQKRYHKKTAMGALDVRHEQLRMLINLAHEMGLFAHQRGKGEDCMAGQHRFLTLSRMWDEIGRMIGGWIGKEFRGLTVSHCHHLRRSCKPTLSECARELRVADAKPDRPILCRHGQSIELDQDCSPLIAQLDASQCPPAISGLVVPVVVDSLDSVIRRRRITHVGHKILKGGQPSRADGNSSSAIVWKKWVFRVRAALFDGHPSCVKRVASGRLRVFNSGAPSASRFHSEAPAGPRSAMPKIRRSNVLGFSTVASAPPSDSPAWLSMPKASHQKSAKALTHQVDCFPVHFHQICFDLRANSNTSTPKEPPCPL